MYTVARPGAQTPDGRDCFWLLLEEVFPGIFPAYVYCCPVAFLQRRLADEFLFQCICTAIIIKSDRYFPSMSALHSNTATRYICHCSRCFNTFLHYLSLTLIVSCIYKFCGYNGCNAACNYCCNKPHIIPPKHALTYRKSPGISSGALFDMP